MFRPPAVPRRRSSPASQHPRRSASFLTVAALAALSTSLVLVACGGGGASSSGGANNNTGGDTNTPAVPTTAPKLTVLNTALTLPWALAFLPDGRLLVTQMGGTMLLLSADGGTVAGPITGLPAVDTSGQSGLMDLAVDPDFDLATNPWVYWTYAEDDGSGATGTAVARGRLSLSSSGGSLSAVNVIYRQTPKVAGGLQFGSRLAFRADKTLWVTLGDRGQDQPANPTADYAQNLATTFGKVVRIARDGSIPAGNPFAGTAGALPEIWSLGHRNPQGAAVHPLTGDLWITEHGPQGGDELNHVQAGLNYGWPLRSYGCPYTVDYTTGIDPLTCRVGGGTHAPNFTEPVSTWTPKSIAPSALIFYTGAKFPEWKNNVLMGAMNSYDSSGYPEIKRGLWRFVLNGDTVVSRERLGLIDDRVRDVRQGPDGWVYLLTDSGQLIRLER